MDEKATLYDLDYDWKLVAMLMVRRRHLFAHFQLLRC
jgi:hypothetical protein